MRLLHDEDADLGLLSSKAIAVIGYGNQGRAQALNLRDSGLDVIIGNRADAYAARAKADRFAVHPIATAASLADVVLLLIPDEIMPAVFRDEIAPRLRQKAVLVFASGYTVAFGLLKPPPRVDTVLVAPRMIGAGVRDLYVEDRGFPAFVGVAQDYSGHARAYALALAKGIGATRMGVAEVTFAQEAELDLFTEQCFGPAFGSVLTSSINLLLDQGYPPEAVLLELYMSGEFAYTLGKIAEMGLVEQAALHSTTSQYGSMSRGLRFQLPELRAKLHEGLDEIRTGAFAQEWTEEQAQGSPTLQVLREAAREMPLHALEQELREALRTVPATGHPDVTPLAARPTRAEVAHRRRLLARLRSFVGRLRGVDSIRTTAPPVAPPTGAAPGTSDRDNAKAGDPPATDDDPAPDRSTLERILRAFLEDATADESLQAFAQHHSVNSAYRLTDQDLTFTLRFAGGQVSGDLGVPPDPAQVQLSMTAAVLDGMLSGRLNATKAALSGDITFEGDARTALTMQRVQKDLIRLYTRARARVLAEK